MSNELMRRSAPVLAILTTLGIACWLALPAVSAVHAARAAWSGSDPQGGPRVEDAVLLLCGATLTGVVGWLLLSVLVCSMTVLRHGVDSLGEAGPLRPHLARALVSTVVGAVVATGSGAPAAGGMDPGTSALPQQLEGLALPERPYGGIRTHRVAAGESLWSITEELLPTGASDHAVARAWPRLHGLNRERLGPDPKVIHPGTTLRLPAWAPAPTRGAAR